MVDATIEGRGDGTVAAVLQVHDSHQHTSRSATDNCLYQLGFMGEVNAATGCGEKPAGNRPSR